MIAGCSTVAGFADTGNIVDKARKLGDSCGPTGTLYGRDGIPLIDIEIEIREVPRFMDAQRYKIEPIEVSALHLDLGNPRFAGMSFEDEDSMIRYLIEAADIEELLLSIINSGYLDFEPIVVKVDDLIVLEGNRRVAALSVRPETF